MTVHAPLSIEMQIARMKALWPGFSVHNVNRSQQFARWIGDATPQFTRYTVEVRYQLGTSPEVRVLNPVLVRLPDNSEGALPHVYPPAEDPTLCLYDPDEKQWDWDMPIAETIIPWALDWLVCYELWLMTGIWTGGGRHAGDPPLNIQGRRSS